MTVKLTEDVLFVGIGKTGADLVSKAKSMIDADYLIISQEEKDFDENCQRLKVSTGAIINPSVQLLRGHTMLESDDIYTKLANYSTIVLVANLSEKAGAAMAPVISHISKSKNLISFVIMPFRYEKDRIFTAGVALKRISDDSECTFVFDNDALFDNNPDLTPLQCYKIMSSSVLHIISSLKEEDMESEVHIISTSKENFDLEASLRDSLKMLHTDAKFPKIKRSLLYVVGGDNVSIRTLNAINSLTANTIENTKVDLATNAKEETKVVMISSVQGETRFVQYDPLGIIPMENTLDWDEPDCNMDCKLELYQLE